MTQQRRSRDSRTLILAGAGRAFGKLGYGPCRVEDIIEESGVSRGTFYKFFDSKEAVFDEIEQAFELSFVQAVHSLNKPELSPEERATGVVDSYLRWLAGWRDIARILWSDPTRPRAETVVNDRVNAFTTFSEILKDLALELGLPEEDPLIYRGILGAISEIGLSVIELPNVTDADLSRARDAILRIVVSTLAPAQQPT